MISELSKTLGRMIGAVVPEPVNVPELPERPLAREKQVNHTSLYIPRQAHRDLQLIALRAGCRVHDLVLDGIDAVLAKHGFAATDRRQRGPKRSGEA